MQKILLLDNYDSFTYNLSHYVNYFDNTSVDVFRNDQISLSAIEKYDAIILSPGPGLPNNAGIQMQLLNSYYNKKKILGVCLGLQAIVEYFGGRLVNLDKVLHGVKYETRVVIKGNLFEKIPGVFMSGRYHSWVADKSHFPDSLQITATDSQGEVMALQHKTLPVYGVQFHPESVLTEYGLEIIGNWIRL